MGITPLVVSAFLSTRSLKFWWIVGLSLKVSEKLKLMECLLSGYNVNYSITKYFWSIFTKRN